MKIVNFVILAIFSLTLACTKENIEIDPDNLLIGIWNYSDFSDNVYLFDRSPAMVNNHCYQFNVDGTLTERKNSGSCGTPPISYADFAGTWTMINDTLVQVDVGYWGGTTTYWLDIESIDSKRLKAVYMQENP